jgi:methylglyoxal synthase
MSDTRKTLALIAQDGKKADMVAFALQHKAVLILYELVATKTTGQLIRDKCGLDIQQVLSGPMVSVIRGAFVSDDLKRSYSPCGTERSST